MKIGIVGGTFDPIHSGHIALGNAALSKLKLDKVLFIPANVPYFKTSKRNVTMPIHRENMVRLATASNPRFEVCDIELKREGNTYTVDTLYELKKIYKDDELYLIVGADTFPKINAWHRPREIFKLCTVVVADRKDQIKSKDLDREIKLAQHFRSAKVIKLKLKGYKISSTKIRKKVGSGKYKIDTPKSVIEYIKTTGLYLNKLKNKQIIARLFVELSYKRFIHTIGVANTALDLAAIFGYNSPKKAYKAALLHDCAKPYADALSHAGKGAKFASSYYGIKDEEILNAIRYHTIGRVDMSLLEKIIFVADFIEPSRKNFKRLDDIRKAAYEDIDKATYMCMESTREYLRRTGKPIDDESNKVYTYYKNLISEETHG